MEDRWKKLGAFALSLAIVAVFVFGGTRIRHDVWPPDSSPIGPNLIASLMQWAIVVIVVVLLEPAVRRRLKRFSKKELDGVHAKLDALEWHHRALRASHRELQETLRRIEQGQK